MNYLGFSANEDYVFNMTVAVPEPTMLSGAGLAVLSLLRRHQKPSDP